MPHALRKARMMSLMCSLLYPVRQLHLLFLEYKTKKDYRLAHNGQVFSLEQVVQDFTGNTSCYITDGELRNEVLVPYDANLDLINYQQPLPYDASLSDNQLRIPYEGDGFETYADFIVHLPQVLYGQINETSLCAVIDLYKIAGKFYRIVYDDIMIEHYTFFWSGENCVLVENIPYTFFWSGENCVLVENIPYSFAWSEDYCVMIEKNAYSFAWSEDYCVMIEKKHSNNN